MAAPPSATALFGPMPVGAGGPFPGHHQLGQQPTTVALGQQQFPQSPPGGGLLGHAHQLLGHIPPPPPSSSFFHLQPQPDQANLALSLDLAQNGLICGQFPPPFGFGGFVDEHFGGGHHIPPAGGLFFPPQPSPTGESLLLMGAGPPPPGLLMGHEQLEECSHLQQQFMLQQMPPPPECHQFLLLHPQNGLNSSPPLPPPPALSNGPFPGNGGTEEGGGLSNGVGNGIVHTKQPRRQTQPRIRRRERMGARNGRPTTTTARLIAEAAAAEQQKLEEDSRLKEILASNTAGPDGIGTGPADGIPPMELATPLPLSAADPSPSASFLAIESHAGGPGLANGELAKCQECGEEIRERQMLLLGGPKKPSTNPNGPIPALAVAEAKLLEEQQQQQGQQQAVQPTAQPQYFHCQCLKCSECEEPLEMAPKCYVRNGLVYCPKCYTKCFVVYCAMCEKQIEPAVWIRRARNWIYHLVCFKCEHCQRQLSTSEQFCLDDTVQRASQVLGGSIPRLLCKQHYMELVRGEQCSPKPKAKRVRTTFGEEQLVILQEHFKIDCNPDGADLERIAQLTGLTKRVTQVWFQNSRARQKKYSGGSAGHRKLANGGGGGPSSSNSSMAGGGCMDGPCRSASMTPASSGGCCPGGQSPFDFGGGNDSEDGTQQGEGRAQHGKLFGNCSHSPPMQNEELLQVDSHLAMDDSC